MTLRTAINPENYFELLDYFYVYRAFPEISLMAVVPAHMNWNELKNKKL